MAKSQDEYSEEKKIKKTASFSFFKVDLGLREGGVGLPEVGGWVGGDGGGGRGHQGRATRHRQLQDLQRLLPVHRLHKLGHRPQQV